MMLRQARTAAGTSPRVVPKCSPVAIFGVGLIITQLVIYHVGMRFSSSQDAGVPASNAFIPQQQQQQRTPIAMQRNDQEIDASKSKRKPIDGSNADAWFQGFPLTYKERKHAYSLSHCVGENYQEGTAWMERSCKFSFLCFDTAEKEFLFFQAPEDKGIYHHLGQRSFIDVSSSYIKQSENKSNTMSIGGINQKWTMKDDGIPRLKWAPNIRTPSDDELLSFYELPLNVVLAPFHSLNGANPGHLVWDDFLPIYTLLTMFQLHEENHLLMMRYILKGGRGLWASCDWREDKTAACTAMHNKFLPLMVGTDYNHKLATTMHFDFHVEGETGEPKSNLVCARHTVVGMGGVTDHGTKKSHGWSEADYELTHNHGRGGLLYDFRNYMLTNLGVNPNFKHSAPFRIVFSEKSSDIPTRVIDFRRQISRLQSLFDPNFVSIESYTLKDLSLREQVEIASQTSIFVTGCGGGAVTSMFMPKGASVLIYYVENGGVVNNKPTGKPARLDWDLFNNLSYLRVHWLPRRTMSTGTDLSAFSLLIRHELDGLLRENSYDHWF